MVGRLLEVLLIDFPTLLFVRLRYYHTTPASNLNGGSLDDLDDSIDINPRASLEDSVDVDTSDSIDIGPEESVNTDTSDSIDISPLESINADTSDSIDTGPLESINTDASDSIDTGPLESINTDAKGPVDSAPEAAKVHVKTPTKDSETIRREFERSDALNLSQLSILNDREPREMEPRLVSDKFFNKSEDLKMMVITKGDKHYFGMGIPKDPWSLDWYEETGKHIFELQKKYQQQEEFFVKRDRLPEDMADKATEDAHKAVVKSGKFKEHYWKGTLPDEWPDGLDTAVIGGMVDGNGSVFVSSTGYITLSITNNIFKDREFMKKVEGRLSDMLWTKDTIGTYPNHVNHTVQVATNNQLIIKDFVLLTKDYVRYPHRLNLYALAYEAFKLSSNTNRFIYNREYTTQYFVGLTLTDGYIKIPPNGHLPCIPITSGLGNAPEDFIKVAEPSLEGVVRIARFAKRVEILIIHTENRWFLAEVLERVARCYWPCKGPAGVTAMTGCAMLDILFEIYKRKRLQANLYDEVLSKLAYIVAMSLWFYRVEYYGGIDKVKHCYRPHTLRCYRKRQTHTYMARQIGIIHNLYRLHNAQRMPFAHALEQYCRANHQDMISWIKNADKRRQFNTFDYDPAIPELDDEGYPVDKSKSVTW